MITIKSIPYEQNFYWKGKRYKQLIRPKFPKGCFTVVCVEVLNGNSEWLEMPSGRKVKPIVRINHGS